ncbi:MAG: peptidyl-prolyl cis-trans isomerase [Verrucomicrobiaceae bacterium]|nr:peptidyl-prolyl cis-trans isomerase [Verrucomicrobiaceae bacterium]
MALIINGEEIDDEAIETEFRQIKGHYERTLQVACCERDPEFRATAKDNIISRVILNNEARLRFPGVDEAAVSARLEKLIEEAGGDHQFAIRIGMPLQGNEDIIRDNVANGVRLDSLLTGVYGEEKEPTEEELQEFYQKSIEQFKSDELIRVVHITKGMDGAKSRQEVYEKMRELRARVKSGEDFEALAEAERGNEQQQIDLGWFKRGEYMEEFETIAFSMDVGEVSPVFTTQLGFHLCKLMDRKPATAVPLDEIREKVTLSYREAERDRRFNEFLAELKKSASIVDTDPPENCGCGH